MRLGPRRRRQHGPDIGACTRESGGREFAFPAFVINDVRVRPKLYVAPRKRFGRQFVAVTNTAGAPVTIDFAWHGNLGADSDTVVGATSSGDISMNQGDRWGTTCDDPDADGCGDVEAEAERRPEIAQNFEGKGSKPHSADLVFDPELNGGETFIEFQDVTIAAGKTVTFMQVVSVALSPKAARQAAKAIDENPARYGVFAGLSEKEKNRLQNW